MIAGPEFFIQSAGSAHVHGMAWSDQRHIASHDIEELRQLVDIGLAKDRTDPGDTPIALHSLEDAGRIAELGSHRAEPVDDHLPSIHAPADLLEENRANGVELYERGDSQKKWKKKDQGDCADDNIEQPFCP
jgi:hypothetical protein